MTLDVVQMNIMRGPDEPSTPPKIHRELHALLGVIILKPNAILNCEFDNHNKQGS